jgi:hypothetical protein
MAVHPLEPHLADCCMARMWIRFTAQLHPLQAEAGFHRRRPQVSAPGPLRRRKMEEKAGRGKVLQVFHGRQTQHLLLRRLRTDGRHEGFPAGSQKDLADKRRDIFK